MRDLLISFIMLAGFLLIAGGVVAWTRQRDAKRAALMVVAALVFFANVAIWLMPLR